MEPQRRGGTGDLYRIDIAAGEYDVLISGLNNPSDIEFIPVTLEAPAGAR